MKTRETVWEAISRQKIHQYLSLLELEKNRQRILANNDLADALIFQGNEAAKQSRAIRRKKLEAQRQALL